MTLTQAQINRVAADAVCDVRTVRKYLQGDRVRGDVSERIRRALPSDSIPTTPDAGAGTARGDLASTVKRGE